MDWESANQRDRMRDHGTEISKKMGYEQRDNTGSLFKSTRKTEPSHADYDGQAKVNGTEYWLNAWINQTKDGRKYLSVKLKPKQAARSNLKVVAGTLAEQMDDEIPF